MAWCWELKRRGADIGVPAQWATLERLALTLGLDGGLDGGALRAFVRCTCGADDPRFLTRGQASACISGLQRWAAGRGAEARSRKRQAIEQLLQPTPDGAPHDQH